MKTPDEIKSEQTAKFNYTGQVDIRTHSSHPCFLGSIDLLTTARIKVSYNPDYVDESRGLEAIVEAPFEQAFTSLLRHELNHKGGGRFHGCPRNIDLHAETILEPVATTFQRLGFPNILVTNDQTLYGYFANLIEDVFDNFELGLNSDHIGMFLDYRDDAEHLPPKLNSHFSPLFSAFIELQQILYGGKRSKKLLSSYYSEDPKVKEAVHNFLSRANLSNKKRTITTRRKKVPVEVLNRKSILSHALDESHWSALSVILTEEFAKLIDKTKLSQPEYISMIFLPLKGESDGFSSEMNDPNTNMKFAFKKYSSSKGFFQPPAFLDPFEALDLVYQRLARNLEIKTRASTSTSSMPIMAFGRKPFDPQRDKLSKARIGFRNGILELTVKPYHIDIPVEHTQRMPSLPEIKFVMFDTSDSMKLPVNSKKGIVMNPWAPENQQWTDNSRYHQGLVAWYSLLELLRIQGTLKRTSVRLANFSSETIVASDLPSAKRLALSPQFGWTNLDMDKMKNLFGRDQLIISLSDGEIQNWAKYLVPPVLDSDGNVMKPGILVSEEYIRRAKLNHYFHLQIGSPSQMSLDLESAGLHIEYDDGSNLGKLVVDLTRPLITRGGKK